MRARALSLSNRPLKICIPNGPSLSNQQARTVKVRTRVHVWVCVWACARVCVALSLSHVRDMLRSNGPASQGMGASRNPRVITQESVRDPYAAPYDIAPVVPPEWVPPRPCFPTVLTPFVVLCVVFACMCSALDSPRVCLSCSCFDQTVRESRSKKGKVFFVNKHTQRTQW